MSEKEGEILGSLPNVWPPRKCESCEMETAGWVWEDGTLIGSDCKARLWGRQPFRGRMIFPDDDHETDPPKRDPKESDLKTRREKATSVKRKKKRKVKREVY